MKNFPDISSKCSNHFSYKDLVYCGETQAETGLANLPEQQKSYDALQAIAQNVLDLVVERFGSLKLTYAFCSSELSKIIPSRIAPKIDQHSSYELNKAGNLICDRGGAAVDFLIDDRSMLGVAKWVVENIHFDRLYFYGDCLPIHVSYGPQETGQIVMMTNKSKNRIVPKVITREAFYELE